jgi:hypothetical protein
MRARAGYRQKRHVIRQECAVDGWERRGEARAVKFAPPPSSGRSLGGARERACAPRFKWARSVCSDDSAASNERAGRGRRGQAG